MTSNWVIATYYRKSSTFYFISQCLHPSGFIFTQKVARMFDLLNY